MTISLNFRIADADGDIGNLAFLATTEAQVADGDIPTIMLGMWDIIAPLQTGRLAGISWNQHFGVFVGTPDVLSDVEEKATFGFDAENDDHTRMSIPCFNEIFLVNGGAGKEVDLTQTEVAAFVTMITGGYPLGGGNNLRAVAFNDELVTALSYATQDFQPRKRKRK